MHKKILRALLSVVLVLAICSVTCTNAFAASFLKNTYVKEVFLSYGNSDDEAKKYLTDNGYEVVDHNLNEGADDTFSTKRSVYLGYKTTSKSDEAITDMKLMNMKGGYSVQDYQMLLTEQKDNIQLFLADFIVAVNEYRSNYKKNQERAVVAHDVLNILYDDDTKQYMGDLLLNKIKEEYTDEEWNALSADEKSKAADMTTILMQGNSDSILIIEQVIALASDDGDSLWIDRYETAKTYDEMLNELMTSKKLSITEAEKQLTAEYDDDAKSIASKLTDYKAYLDENYVNSGITLTSSEEERAAYEKDKDDFDAASWFVAGTQYELLATLKNDDVSLLDLVNSDDYDVTGEDSYLLYPLVSVLTKGQRACLDFLSMYQIVSCGINGNEAIKEASEGINLAAYKEEKISVYDGVDRTLFTGDVALTSEALRLQASTGKSAVSGIGNYVSNLSIALYCVTGLTFVATTVSWISNASMSNTLKKMNTDLKSFQTAADKYSKLARKTTDIEQARRYTTLRDNNYNGVDRMNSAIGSAKHWSKIMRYASITLTCITLVLLGLSAWSTYNDLKEYYNAEFTPIPQHMVNQATNDKDEKVYTYYNAVECNRVVANMVTDSNKLLGDFGDLNGDVGRQWVALYTTTDKAAGDPITTDFVVQYNDSNIPNDTVALSMFGESVAQNLTNKKMSYTYADGKSGIYLFFDTDTSIFAGSIFSNGTYALFGAGIIVICGVAVILIKKASKNRKNGKEANANA